MLHSPEKCRQDPLFTFIGIKKTPITDGEYEHLVAWQKKFKRRKPDYPVFVWRYLPQKQTENHWTEVVRKENLFDTPSTDPAKHNLAIITDDKPFPFDIFLTREALNTALKNISFLALIMVLLPTFIAFIAIRRKESALMTPQLGLNALMIAYFCVLGIAYLCIEMVLIQKFGFFLSSPVYSLAIVLSTMLIFSGLGGYFFGKVAPRKALFLMGALVAVGTLAWLALGPTLEALIKLPFALRVVTAIVILAPISFLMGIPFPFAISLSKSEMTPSHAGLFFGINGALGAVASPLTVLLSMMIGFQQTLLIGVGAYLVCGLLLLFALPLLKKAA